MSCIVFLGPTLSRPEAQRILPDATYWPPVAQGSVLRAIDQGARALVIIDGTFESEPSVWHKEILFALSRGARVFGSSSMGALRAAETHVFGTEGVGQIFAWYRDGELEDDDEVAVSHADASGGYRQLSTALVNIRWGLAAAARHAIIPADAVAPLIALSKRRYYPERSWAAVVDDCRVLELPADVAHRLDAFVRDTRPDLKADDARVALRLVADQLAAGWDRPNPSFDFEPTSLWQLLTDHEAAVETAGAHPVDVVTIDDLHEHVMVGMPNRDQIRRTAMELLSLEAAADHLGLRARYGPLTPDELFQLIDARQEGRGRRYYVAALDKLGLRAAAVNAVRSKKRLARQQGWDAAETHQPFAAEPATLLRWYESRYGNRVTDLDREAALLGIRSGDELLRAVLHQYMFEAAEGRPSNGEG